MDIEKGTRHSKIIGNFGEVILLNWLSRSGFDVCLADQTGLDVIAYHTKSKKRLGFTVKSRTRDNGKKESSVNIFSYQKEKDDRQKLLDTCKAFACEPWIAVYVETQDYADLYLTSLKHYDAKYKSKDRGAIDDWKMGERYTKEYAGDPEVRHIHTTFQTTNWEW